MRFPARPLLTAIVIAALTASGYTAATMSAATPDAAVDVPEFARAAGQADPTPQPAPLTAGPPVTGAQISALAIGPATDRVTALIAERAAVDAEAARQEAAKAEADRAAADQAAAQRAETQRAETQRAAAERARARRQAPPDRISEADLRRLREEVRRACDDGRLRGRICREV